jgi:hypothetical protein
MLIMVHALFPKVKFIGERWHNHFVLCGPTYHVSKIDLMLRVLPIHVGDIGILLGQVVLIVLIQYT